MTKRFARALEIGSLALCLQGCVELPQTPAFTHADAGAPEAASACAPLRIGSWNLRKLGFDTQKDVALIARVLEAHFDLVDLVEIVWSEDDAVYLSLVDALGPGWQLMRTKTPRPNVASPHAEYYTVALRRARVAPCNEGDALRYVEDGDGSSESATRGLFLREPAYGCFRPRDGQPALVFGVYHALWGQGDVTEIAAEVSQLDLAIAAMAGRFPDVAQLFVAGDFNLDSQTLAPLTRATDRTQGEGSTLDAEGNPSAHLYDHLLAASEAAERALRGDARVLDVRDEAESPRAFRERVSDHLPIVAELACDTHNE